MISVTVTNKDYHASTCRWNKLLTCFVMFWAKQQLRMHFIQSLSLKFLSVLDLYLNESDSSGDNNPCHPWYHGIALAGAIESQICSFHFFFFLSILKVHINWNDIQRLYGLMGKNTWIINSRFSQTFNLVYTDTS